MSRFVTIILTCMTVILALADEPEAQVVTAAKCFTEAPDAIVKLLPRNTRLDMLDYFHAGSPKVSVNAAGGKCKIISESDTSIMYQAADGVVCQLFVLNPSDARSMRIGLIETVDTPAPDSRVTIFDSRWIDLTSATFKTPRLSDWTRGISSDLRDDVEQSIPMLLAEYTFDPLSSTLTVKSSMDQYYTSTDRPQALRHVSPILRYSWDGRRFKLQR